MPPASTGSVASEVTCSKAGYQALLIQPGPTLAKVVNYIHLNPVRAAIVPLEQLAQFRWSSYRTFSRRERPVFLVCDWLRELGGLTDDVEGWSAYQAYLGWLASDEQEKRQALETFSRGWAIGSADWRKAVARDHAQLLGLHRLREREVAELKEATWSRSLDELLMKANRTRSEVTVSPKGADWKVAIAAQLRRITTATNAWIARELQMGSPGAVSVYLSRSKLSS